MMAVANVTWSAETSFPIARSTAERLREQDTGAVRATGSKIFNAGRRDVTCLPLDAITRH